MATHFRISYGKWRQPFHIGAAQSRLTNPARVARRQDCDSHQKLVLIRSGALRLEILFEVSYPAPALFNGGRVDGSFRRHLAIGARNRRRTGIHPTRSIPRSSINDARRAARRRVRPRVSWPAGEERRVCAIPCASRPCRLSRTPAPKTRRLGQRPRSRFAQDSPLEQSGFELVVPL
jgi:hypothetical protein